MDDAWMELMLSPYDYGKDALYEKDTRALMEKISWLGIFVAEADGFSKRTVESPGFLMVDLSMMPSILMAFQQPSTSP